ncbi:VIP36-like protein [Thelohanellus kitauei]|uniref:VIP36-like protein n=1 Tax=Thelohanellus kitauei TaxID=669202 RepID=A0A0C2MCS7_THEKT|nr:VIP36-like protein [Thelohanellus kitauei]
MDNYGWTTSGTALISSDKIILTSDTKSQAGSIWLLKVRFLIIFLPVHFRNWRVKIDFRIHSEGKKLFGDGLAFWYIKSYADTGSVYGVNERFNGLGIILDTYPNHEKSEEYPRVSAQLNDGTKMYDALKDGFPTEFESCSYDFRRSSTNIFISYFGSNSTLVVEFEDPIHYIRSSCIMSDFVLLPTGYYIGISAATGDLSDNHEVYSVDFESLDDMFHVDRQTSAKYEKVKPELKNFHKQIPEAKRESGGFWRFIKRLSLFILILFIGGTIVQVAYMIWKKREKERRKRFY